MTEQATPAPAPSPPIPVPVPRPPAPPVASAPQPKTVRVSLDIIRSPRSMGAPDPVETLLKAAGFDLRRPYRSEEDDKNRCFVYTQDATE